MLYILSIAYAAQVQITIEELEAQRMMVMIVIICVNLGKYVNHQPLLQSRLIIAHDQWALTIDHLKIKKEHIDSY